MTDTRLKHHAALVDRMANIRGIDLEEASMRAGFTPDDLADMVQQCAGCAQPDTCVEWMSRQTGAVSETPPYCRNTEVFKKLAQS